MKPYTLALAAALWSGAAAAASSRFALAVGSNEGAAGRTRLWFAERDAERLGQALVELGAFDPAEVRVVKSPGVERLRAEIAGLADRALLAVARGEAPLVFFYYSGHADRQGLELASERLPYTELSALLSKIPEGVRVAILDACHAGSLTQVKGATPAPLDFEIPSEPRADGVAIITSSTASETAQESAALGGSFFTHHLTLGLRGAADADGDGRITLGESYRYAYHRTLAATAEAGVTPQHPTYAIRMAGKGEVVLVDLRRARSTLAFAPGAGRSYLVTSEKTMEVVAEIASAEEPLRVALPAGRYRVERILPAPRLTGVVELPPEGSLAVDDAALAPVVALASRQKGEGEAAQATLAFAEAWLGTAVLSNFGAAYGVGIGLRLEIEAWTVLLEVAYADKPIDDAGFGFVYHFRALTASVGGAYRLKVASVEVLLGGRLGVSYAHQRWANEQQSGSVILQAGPSASAVVPLSDRLRLRIDWTVLAHSFQLVREGANRERVARGSLQIATALEYAL